MQATLQPSTARELQRAGHYVHNCGLTQGEAVNALGREIDAEKKANSEYAAHAALIESLGCDRETYIRGCVVTAMLAVGINA